MFAPNLRNAPNFNPKEIQHLFEVLKYPYTIRSDAITAVGAPSTIGILVKAIFWLYLIARVYYGRPEAILEDSAEDEGESIMESKQKTEEITKVQDDQEYCLFKRILETAERSQHSFETPHQVNYKLPNGIEFPTNPLLNLILFEYQEFLH